MRIAFKPKGPFLIKWLTISKEKVLIRQGRLRGTLKEYSKAKVNKMHPREWSFMQPVSPDFGISVTVDTLSAMPVNIVSSHQPILFFSFHNYQTTL